MLLFMNTFICNVETHKIQVAHLSGSLTRSHSMTRLAKPAVSRSYSRRG
jgi:hypothetical protein